MDILACRPEENSYNILPSAATMLFHGLPAGDVHSVVEEMDRRAKSESVAISSAIDMGETETVNGTPALGHRRHLAAREQPVSRLNVAGLFGRFASNKRPKVTGFIRPVKVGQLKTLRKLM